ncbi:MAG: hypothetical protein AAGH99_06255 [Planctomycetota bacterium]
MNTPSDPAANPSPEPLHPEKMTWAVLLGRWVAFAKSALALPKDAEGQRLRDAVPDIINLQAVWFSLSHLDELDADQRALGLDRAEVLIEKHRNALSEAWGEEALPEQLVELIEDAETALRQHRSGGESPD